jgi:hypothetical protein
VGAQFIRVTLNVTSNSEPPAGHARASNKGRSAPLFITQETPIEAPNISSLWNGVLVQTTREQGHHARKETSFRIAFNVLYPTSTTIIGEADFVFHAIM